MRVVIVFCVIAVSWMLPNSAHAQTRHALVIGIDDYAHVEPLQKARNDASAVHAALQAAGFRSDLMLDSDGMALLQGLERFASRIQPGDEAVFFFAGHGVELDGENILLPADIPAPRQGGDLLVRRFGVPVNDVLDQIQRRGARLSLLIL
ncbi:MAG: caspase family protein, partial [Rhodobacteraceae bacterium]|nr:caspase family protein [Paracoccaceae bacterium]